MYYLRQAYKLLLPWYFSLSILLVIVRLFFLKKIDSSDILNEISVLDILFSYLRDLQLVFLILTLHTFFLYPFQRKNINWINRTNFLPPIIVLILCLIFDQYYLISNEPLDEGIYLFSWNELWMILGLQHRVTFYLVFGVLILFSSFFFLTYFIRRFFLKTSDGWITKLFISTLIGAVTMPFCISHNEEFPDSDPIINNKLSYFFRQSITFFFNTSQRGYKIRWQEFKELDPTFYGANFPPTSGYPTWHSLSKNSSLNEHFRKTSNGKPPNIVFIIVESMSSDLFGLRSNYRGSIMPFMDSLSKQSLYFPNTFSTSQRTHNVLPAILCSTPNPFDGAVFQQIALPNHWSLMSLLRKDYFSRFYCGVDLDYLNMQGFMNYHNVDYSVRKWSKECQLINTQTNSPWGFPDEALFRQSLQDSGMIRSSKKSTFDVFLTISSHDPFIYPEKESYTKKVQALLPGILASPLKNKIEANASSFGSFLYCDEQIKFFLEAYKKKEAYKNTIFIITGDHGTEMYNTNKLAKYNVPLVIYSPLLKAPFLSKSVVSHVDIAPSIVSYLKKAYKVALPDSIPFVGSELSFSPNFLAARNLIFTTNKLMSNELMHKDQVLLGNRLFRFDEQLNLFPINNAVQKSKLLKMTKLYQLFSRYCIHQNKLVPKTAQSIWFDGGLWKLVTSQSKSNFTSKKNELSLIGKAILPNNKRNLRIELTCSYYCRDQNDLNKLSDLIIQLNDSKWIKQEFLVYKAIRPVFKYRFIPNHFNEITYSVEFNPSLNNKLKSIKALYCYLFNSKLKAVKIEDVSLKTYFRK